MNKQESQDILIKELRDFVASGLLFKTKASNPEPLKTVAKAFETAISKIPDKVIYELIDQPKRKIIIYTIKPKTNEHNNASHKTNRNRRASRRNPAS